jgi:hypothetical protein
MKKSKLIKSIAIDSSPLLRDIASIPEDADECTAPVGTTPSSDDNRWGFPSLISQYGKIEDEGNHARHPLAGAKKPQTRKFIPASIGGDLHKNGYFGQGVVSIDSLLSHLVHHLSLL